MYTPSLQPPKANSRARSLACDNGCNKIIVKCDSSKRFETQKILYNQRL